MGLKLFMKCLLLLLSDGHRVLVDCKGNLRLKHYKGSSKYGFCYLENGCVFLLLADSLFNILQPFAHLVALINYTNFRRKKQLLLIVPFELFAGEP